MRSFEMRQNSLFDSLFLLQKSHARWHHYDQQRFYLGKEETLQILSAVSLRIIGVTEWDFCTLNNLLFCRMMYKQVYFCQSVNHRRNIQLHTPISQDSRKRRKLGRRKKHRCNIEVRLRRSNIARCKILLYTRKVGFYFLITIRFSTLTDDSSFLRNLIVLTKIKHLQLSERSCGLQD